VLTDLGAAATQVASDRRLEEVDEHADEDPEVQELRDDVANRMFRTMSRLGAMSGLGARTLDGLRGARGCCCRVPPRLLCGSDRRRHGQRGEQGANSECGQTGAARKHLLC